MPAPTKHRRRAPHRDQVAAADAARAQRLTGLHQQLAEGVAAIRDGESWTRWLDTAAKFHTYSVRNQILIAQQNPKATQIGGYRAWQAMGRQVRKGEKALWVLAPVTRRAADPDQDSELTPDEHITTATDSGDSPAARRVVGFRGVGVFDVSQTEGDPLPGPPEAHLLAGQAPAGLWDALEQVIVDRGYTVHRARDAAALGGANGLTDFLTRTVSVRGDVDDAQAVKTLAHEAGHLLLHSPLDPTEGRPACRGLLEVEAESVAYLVAAHHGLDTSGYTFNYIAGWAGDNTDAVTATAERVMAAARTLLAVTDPTDSPTTSGTDLAAVTAQAAAAATDLADRATATRDRSAAPRTPTLGADTARLRALTSAAQTWFTTQAAHQYRLHGGGHRPRAHPAGHDGPRHRVGPEQLDRARRPPPRPGPHRHRHARRRGGDQHPTRPADRPVPRADHLPHSRPRRGGRLDRAGHHRPRHRPEIPQLPHHRPVRQEHHPLRAAPHRDPRARARRGGAGRRPVGRRGREHRHRRTHAGSGGVRDRGH